MCTYRICCSRCTRDRRARFIADWRYRDTTRGWRSRNRTYCWGVITDATGIVALVNNVIKSKLSTIRIVTVEIIERCLKWRVGSAFSGHLSIELTEPQTLHLWLTMYWASIFIVWLYEPLVRWRKAQTESEQAGDSRHHQDVVTVLIYFGGWLTNLLPISVIYIVRYAIYGVRQGFYRQGLDCIALKASSAVDTQIDAHVEGPAILGRLCWCWQTGRGRRSSDAKKYCKARG